MLSTPIIPPGFTKPEKLLLQAMVDELYDLVGLPGWEQRLPLNVRHSYFLERLGNPVELVLKLHQRAGRHNEQTDSMLLLKIRILGTGNERWDSANGAAVLCQGTASQVAAAICAYHAAIGPVQEQLAQHYRSTFYNA